MDKIIELLTLPLAAHEEALNTLKLSMLMAIRSGNTHAFEKQMVDGAKLTVCAFEQINDSANINIVNKWDIDNSNLPQNSVAFIAYEGVAYPWKNFELENLISIINQNPRIIACVLLINTPGGSIHRVDTASAAISNSTKPIVGYITGMCCSAGQWISSACKKLYAGSEMDLHGSIGTMATLINDTKFIESLGVEIMEFYADKSTRKNAKSRDAMAGNAEPIIADLNMVNELFHKAIAKNRNISADTNEDVFNGSDFYTKKAIELGLCDGIATLDQVFSYALIEGMRYKSKQ